MKIEVEKIRGEDAWIVRLDEEQEQRFRHLALCSNTEIRGVIEKMLTDGVGFAIELLKMEKPEIVALIEQMCLKSGGKNGHDRE